MAKTKSYTFDLRLWVTLTVPAATSPEDAEAQLREAMNGASINAGAWKNGDPILAEGGLASDDEVDLVEIDGEAV